MITFGVTETVLALIFAYPVGWLLGIVIWLLRYLMIDMPHGGVSKGSMYE